MHSKPFVFLCAPTKLKRSSSQVSRSFDGSSHKSREYTNYKPLISSDVPIDIEEDPFKEEIIVKPTIVVNYHVKIDYGYIKDIYDIVKSMKLPTLSLHNNLTLPRVPTQNNVVFIDLDDTLINSYYAPKQKYSQDKEISDTFYLSFRPYLFEFLTSVSKIYEIIVQTSTGLFECV